MIKLPATIILIYYLLSLCDSGTLPAVQLAEQTLIRGLLNGYDKTIRPDDQVSVDITASLQQIVAMDEKQQIMTSSSFISQTWFDDRLSWTPNASNYNIDVIMVSVKSIWIPDTMILNSADANAYLTVSDYSLASVYYSGQVYLILPALTVRTRCSLMVLKFPFDQQTCSINVTSWSQGSNRILYTDNSTSVIDVTGYTEHPLWKLTGTDLVVIRAGDRAPYEETYNDVIAIELYLRRKPLFFIMNGIFACLILNCVTLLSFALAFATQVSLCMVCFMTYSVYSLNFSNLFPQQSEYLMMITLYFLLSIGWTLLSMAWFLVYNHFTTKGEMPKFLYNFCVRLQKLFFCCFPSPKQDNTNKMNAENGIASIKTDANRVNPAETAVNISMNYTNESLKPKCNFCNRCESCQSDVDKDKVKAKNKKDIESKCNALNYFVFLCILLLMFVSNMAIWLTMAN